MRTGASGVALVLALVLAGCSSPVPGPSAAPTRPRDVRLDGIDPCTLLTPAQRVELGLDQPPQQLANGDRPLCSWRGEEPRAIDTSVTMMTTAGVERYQEQPGRTTVTSVQLRDFHALRIILRDHPEFCLIAVDVAPGQALEIQFADDGRPPPIPQSQLCVDALHVADLTLANLLATR